MKNIFFILFLAACSSSVDKSVQLPPNIFVVNTDVHLKNVNGCWWWKQKKFNGYVLEKNNTIVLAKLPVINGKENGVAYGWYMNGKKRYQRGYRNGNREGAHMEWYENEKIASLYFFHDDKFEGEQRTYYQSGHLWQSLNYIDGYEEGKQISKNDDGRVVNNFTIKNGKLYGVVGRFDCMSVSKN